MLIKGQWSDEDKRVIDGVYARAASAYQDEIPQTVLEQIKDQPGRFVIFASYSCGWSHRIMLARIFKQVESLLPVHIIGGKRIQGYPLNDNQPFHMPNSDRIFTYLHQVYSLNDPQYTGRATVPVLWDTQQEKIVCNESTTILKALNALNPDAPDLYPQSLAGDIDKWNSDSYECLSNAVYQVGFSQKQQEKQRNIDLIDAFLARLEGHLESNKFLLGDTFTEADIRLFSTLIRFDTCYYTLFKCASKQLIEYPNTMSYTRYIYQLPGVSESINFDVMYQACKENDSFNSQHILPMPGIDWQQAPTRKWDREEK